MTRPARPVPRQRRTPPGHQRGPTRTGRCGFTLIELMVVVFLLGLTLLIGAPFLQQAARDRHAAAAARELMSDLGNARDDAVHTNVPHAVSFCRPPGMPPGFVVIRCEDGTPPRGSYDAAVCDGSLDVCALLQAPESPAPAQIVRRIALGGGAAADRSLVRFGVAGALTPAPRRTVDPPADGLDLGECDPEERRRFFFDARGRLVGATPQHAPCTAALYLTGRSNSVATGNRAVTVSSVGALRVFRSAARGGWEG